MDALIELALYIENCKRDGKKVISIDYVEAMVRIYLHELEGAISACKDKIVS